jgi:catechol 2,3-dioxygenase-like lactoylglutathione lyase family enzyme
MKLLLTAALALCLATPAYAQLAPPNKAGLTFGHVQVNVRDVELHKKLWVEHFGGIVVQKGPITAIKWPGMLLILNKAEPTGGSQGTVADHFGFKVKDTAATAAKWRAAGLEVQGEIFTGAEGFPNIYLMAPDGVRVELQEDKTMTQPVIGYHVHFLSPDFVKLMDWYVQTFGLEPFQRGSIKTTANAPGMNFSFGAAKMPAPPTKGRAIDHIGFEIDNLEAYCKALQAKGVKFDIPYRVDPVTGLKSAFLTDPLGTYIQLTEGLDQY